MKFRRFSRGMTMIELVAALSIFAIIALVLFTMLNTSTHLWSAPSSTRKQAAEAEGFLDLLASDLEQAVADGGDITNPVFYAWALPLSANAEASHPFIGFVRPALPYGPPSSGTGRFSLDCVTYTFSTGCLSRTVTSLPFQEDGGTVGQRIRNVKLTDPSTVTSLLVKHAVISEPSYVFDSHGTINGPFSTNVLPLAVNVVVIAFRDEDWPTYLSLANANSDEATLKKKSLGVSRSRVIHLPAYAGGALP